MSALGPDDIEAFAESNANALEAAVEFARRSRKGIPPDRWCDGTSGAHMVARGIEAWMQMYQLASGAFLHIHNDAMRANQGATEIYPEDSKYNA